MTNGLSGDEFNKFFEDLVNIASNVNRSGASNESILELMERYGLPKPQLPEPLAKRILPLLNSKTKMVNKQLTCSDCGICSVCIACFPTALNAGAIGAGSATISTYF